MTNAEKEQQALEDLASYLLEAEGEIAIGEEDKGELLNVFRWFIGREPLTFKQKRG